MCRRSVVRTARESATHRRLTQSVADSVPVANLTAPLPSLELDKFDSSTSLVEDSAADTVVTDDQAVILNGPSLVTTVGLDVAIATTSALTSVFNVGATTGATTSTSTVTVTTTDTGVTAAHIVPANVPSVAVESDLENNVPDAGASADSDLDIMAVATFEATEAAASVVFTTLASVKTIISTR